VPPLSSDVSRSGGNWRTREPNAPPHAPGRPTGRGGRRDHRVHRIGHEPADDRPRVRGRWIARRVEPGFRAAPALRHGRCVQPAGHGPELPADRTADGFAHRRDAAGPADRDRGVAAVRPCRSLPWRAVRAIVRPAATGGRVWRGAGGGDASRRPAIAGLQPRWIRARNSFLGIGNPLRRHRAFDETRWVDRTCRQIEQAPPFPDLPLAVVTAARPPPSRLMPVEAVDVRWTNQEALLALAPESRQFHAAGSSHYPQLSEPTVVVDAVRWIIERCSNSELQRTTPRPGSEA